MDNSSIQPIETNEYALQTAQYIHKQISSAVEQGNQLSQTKQLVDEIELNLALQRHGLSTEGDYTERLERWKQYKQQQHELHAKHLATMQAFAQSFTRQGF